MIGSNVLIQIFSSLAGSIITFFTLSLSARLFGPSILGNLAFVISLFGLVFAFADLGFSRAHVHFTASLKKAGKTLGTFIRIKLLLLTLTGLLATILGLTKTTSFKGLFLLMLICQLSSRLAEAILITFEGLQVSIPQNTIRLISKAFRLLAVIILGYSLKNNFGYSLTFLAESLSLVILAFFVLSRFKPLKYSKSLARKYLKYSLPFFAIFPLSYFLDHGVVVILKNLSTTIQVGYFSASQNLAGFVKSLFGSVMIFFFPQISKLFSKKDHQSIEKYLNLTLKYLLLLMTPLLMFLFLLRREIVSLVLGAQFSPAVPVFSLFLLGTYLLMILAPYDQVLFATRNHQPLIYVNLVSLIVALTSSYFLVPILNSQGAVLSLIIAWIINGIWHLWLIKKRLQLVILPQIFKFIFPAILLLILSESVMDSYYPTLVIKLLISLVSLSLYLIFLYGFKVFNKKDIRYFASLINLAKK